MSVTNMSTRELVAAGLRVAQSVPWVLLFSSLLCVTLEGEVGGRASADAVAPLIRMFNATGQHAVAAADPREPGFFVAAVYTGTDLFLVRAQHPAGDELARRIHSGQHQRVFFALRATPTPSRKFYVYDAGANGLRPTARPGDAADDVRLDGVRLTSVEYTETLNETDARYADLLKLLSQRK
jgi:hypothetical protein